MNILNSRLRTQLYYRELKRMNSSLHSLVNWRTMNQHPTLQGLPESSLPWSVHKMLRSLSDVNFLPGENLKRTMMIAKTISSSLRSHSLQTNTE
jgi:hypothetical protein